MGWCFGFINELLFVHSTHSCTTQKHQTAQLFDNKTVKCQNKRQMREIIEELGLALCMASRRCQISSQFKDHSKGWRATTKIIRIKDDITTKAFIHCVEGFCGKPAGKRKGWLDNASFTQQKHYWTPPFLQKIANARSSFFNNKSI